MGWVDPPKFFCAFSETLTDVTNALVDSELPVPSYSAISEMPSTGPGPPHTPESLTRIDYYMDDVISVVQGGPDRQHRVFDCTVRALKWIFPSLPGELKDLGSVKKLVAGEGDWTCVKEVLGWIFDTEAGTVALPERKLEYLLTMVDIPPTQRRMGRKDLERLVGKLRSMHLAVPGAVAHLFHIQRALNQGGGGPGLAIAGISSGARRLECAFPPGGVPTDAPGINCLSGAHPYGSFVTRWVWEPEACGSTRPGQVRIWSGDCLGPLTLSLI